MKKLNLMLFIAVAIICTACKGNRNSQSVRVKDNAKMYSFEAHYPERKTNQVFEFVEATLNNHQLFDGQRERELTAIVLPDHTQFDLAYQPGYIEIRFNKHEISQPSYLKMKKLGEGIAKLLK